MEYFRQTIFNHTGIAIAAPFDIEKLLLFMK